MMSAKFATFNTVDERYRGRHEAAKRKARYLAGRRQDAGGKRKAAGSTAIRPTGVSQSSPHRQALARRTSHASQRGREMGVSEDGLDAYRRYQEKGPKEKPPLPPWSRQAKAKTTPASSPRTAARAAPKEVADLKARILAFKAMEKVPARFPAGGRKMTSTLARDCARKDLLADGDIESNPGPQHTKGGRPPPKKEKAGPAHPPRERAAAPARATAPAGADGLSGGSAGGRGKGVTRATKRMASIARSALDGLDQAAAAQAPPDKPEKPVYPPAPRRRYDGPDIGPFELKRFCVWYFTLVSWLTTVTYERSTQFNSRPIVPTSGEGPTIEQEMDRRTVDNTGAELAKGDLCTMNVKVRGYRLKWLCAALACLIVGFTAVSLAFCWLTMLLFALMLFCTTSCLFVAPINLEFSYIPHVMAMCFNSIGNSTDEQTISRGAHLAATYRRLPVSDSTSMQLGFWSAKLSMWYLRHGDFLLGTASTTGLQLPPVLDQDGFVAGWTRSFILVSGFTASVWVSCRSPRGTFDLLCVAFNRATSSVGSSFAAFPTASALGTHLSRGMAAIRRSWSWVWRNACIVASLTSRVVTLERLLLIACVYFIANLAYMILLVSRHGRGERITL